MGWLEPQLQSLRVPGTEYGAGNPEVVVGAQGTLVLFSEMNLH